MLKTMSAARPPDWLLPLFGEMPGASLLVGGVGHLLLNREEEAVVTAALEARVLPLLRDLAAGRPITLFTGLAPGADVLLMDRASSWCERNGVQLIKVGLCPVPIPQLIDDWIRRAEQQGYTLSRADHHWLHSSVHAALAGCDAVAHLYKPGEEAALTDPVHRQKNYRQLAAVLAEYSDVLVAVLHDDHQGAEGGTAEVVAWRQNPTKIPPQYATRPPEQHPRPEMGLIVVNPMPAKVTLSSAGGDARAAKALTKARAAMAAGNDLLANDILYHALKQGLQHPELHFLRVKALAGMGSCALALREYEALAPPMSERDERWMTLLGRIKKDQGLRSGNARFFEDAAAAYLDAWARFGGSYSLINAASTLTLGKHQARARELALQTLAAIDGEAKQSAEDRYFAAATCAEAALILGHHDQLRRYLVEADGLLPLRAPQRSRTLRQLRRVCEALQVDPQLLAPLKLPPLILLRRLGRAELTSRQTLDAGWISALPVSASVFAGICDSFDLLLAEALQNAGHNVHLVLPYRAQRLLTATKAQLGDSWVQRLQHCLDRAAHLYAERGFLDGELDWAASHVTERALGLALLDAQRIGGLLTIVDIDPDASSPSIATAPSFEEGQARAGKALAHLYAVEPPRPSCPGRRMVGLIFADFAGFQRLEDPELPYFWQGLMHGISQRLLRHGDAILLRHTWGDALHVVTADALTAAEVMADIQHYLEQHRLNPEAPLAGLSLRIAGHYAPAYEGHDPIHDARTYYGTQLSLTARIEPVTPPGQIYATESFAARLAIEGAEHFTLEYTGEMELAKGYGAYRLYALRRLEDPAG